MAGGMSGIFIDILFYLCKYIPVCIFNNTLVEGNDFQEFLIKALILDLVNHWPNVKKYVELLFYAAKNI